MIRLFTSVLLLLVAGAAFFGYTQPTYSKVQELKQEAAQLDSLLGEASEFQKLKSQLMARYNSLPSETLARLNKLLPDHVDNVRLILDVDSLAAQDQLSLDNVIINTAEDSSSSGTTQGQAAGPASALGTLAKDKLPYDSLTLQFKTVGTYQHFTQFLRQLQTSLRLVDVVGISATSNATDGQGKTAQEPTYTYGVKVQTYWLK